MTENVENHKRQVARQKRAAAAIVENNKRQVAREKRAAAAISAGTAGAELLYRKPAVLLLTGMGATWLHAEIKAGRFPRPVKIGARAVAWRRSEVEAWLAGREAA